MSPRVKMSAHNRTYSGGIKEELDQLGVLQAIYPEIKVDRTNGILMIPNTNTTKGDEAVRITLLEDNPTRRFEISAPAMPSEHKKRLASELAKMLAREGSSLQDVINHVLHFFMLQSSENISEKGEMSQCPNHNEKASPSKSSSTTSAHQEGSMHACSRTLESTLPEIFSGEPLEDRKSIFQAHVARINSKEEAMRVLARLRENGKIARATHNMYAWRTVSPPGSTFLSSEKPTEQHDCDDDGEDGAGPKLLHLLSLMKAENLVVVVTRWYGGRQLGPDRFRHICNVARECMLQFGFAVKR